MVAEKPKTILVVDDDPGMRSLLTALLNDEGFQVLTASDGQSGLQAAREGKPDLILLDVTLPKMDGYHVARLLKFDLNFEHIPIIMQSAKGSSDELKTGQDVGVDAYFVKPYEPMALLAKIKEILKNREEKLEV